MATKGLGFTVGELKACGWLGQGGGFAFATRKRTGNYLGREVRRERRVRVGGRCGLGTESRAFSLGDQERNEKYKGGLEEE